MYFFALYEDDMFRIDAVGHSLEDSFRFEAVDISQGLIAWDESGVRYRFSPQSGSPHWTVRSEGIDVVQFEEALRKFVHYILGSRHHSRRAHRLGIDTTDVESLSLDGLLRLCRSLQLEDDY